MKRKYLALALGLTLAFSSMGVYAEEPAAEPVTLEATAEDGEPIESIEAENTMEYSGEVTEITEDTITLTLGVLAPAGMPEGEAPAVGEAPAMDEGASEGKSAEAEASDAENADTEDGGTEDAGAENTDAEDAGAEDADAENTDTEDGGAEDADTENTDTENTGEAVPEGAAGEMPVSVNFSVTDESVSLSLTDSTAVRKLTTPATVIRGEAVLDEAAPEDAATTDEAAPEEADAAADAAPEDADAAADAAPEGADESPAPDGGKAPDGSMASFVSDDSVTEIITVSDIQIGDIVIVVPDEDGSASEVIVISSADDAGEDSGEDTAEEAASEADDASAADGEVSSEEASTEE